MRTNQLIHLLPDMAVFARVVASGSFSAVARELGLSPSAVSRQISRLEQELGVRLLERSTRKLRLTELGSEVFGFCQQILNSAQATQAVSEQFMALPRGRVVLAAPKAFSRLVLQPLIPAFLARYPDIELQLLVADREVDWIEDAVDVAIRITEQPPQTLVARPLLKVRQLLCASPRYLERYGRPEQPLDLLRHQCLVLGEQAGDQRWHFRRGAENVSVEVGGRYAVNHSEMRLDGILHELGIGCLPMFTAQAQLQSGELVEVLPDWELLTSYQGMAWLLYAPNRFLPPKVRALIDYLGQAVK